jgi:hypothetical protein
MANVRLLFRGEVRFAHLAIDRPESIAPRKGELLGCCLGGLRCGLRFLLCLVLRREFLLDLGGDGVSGHFVRVCSILEYRTRIAA